MIVSHHLTKRFGTTLAVDDLTFTVTPGVVTGCLGPNGSGKSTTMRMIMGLDLADSGSTTVNGVPYKNLRWPLRAVGAITPLLPLLLQHGNGRPGRFAPEVIYANPVASVVHQPGFFSATVGFSLMTAYTVAAISLGAVLLGRRDA
jgi:ABC-type cobalamin/Fe3+-siderophores transport system ATPase subunit